jgi:hypothetical protein
MFKHIVLIVSLTCIALAAGVAMVPGDREQWTMLMRDGHNEQALKVLEAHHNAGQRDADTVLHLYKLYMSFADIDQATRIMRGFVADRPGDPAALTLLAKHYGDIQDKRDEIATLEELFKVAPSLPTAHTLLSYYRLEGTFDREERLLRTLLANEMITANDAERLGLMLAATGDLYGARDALTRFDEIANPERIVGRLALFDVLVQIGDKSTALAKGASWIGYWRKANTHRNAGQDTPAGRLVRMMLTVDEAAALRFICDAQREEQGVSPGEGQAQVMCNLPGQPTGSIAPDSTVAEQREQLGRRRQP